MTEPDLDTSMTEEDMAHYIGGAALWRLNFEYQEYFEYDPEEPKEIGEMLKNVEERLDNLAELYKVLKHFEDTKIAVEWAERDEEDEKEQKVNDPTHNLTPSAKGGRGKTLYKEILELILLRAKDEQKVKNKAIRKETKEKFTIDWAESTLITKISKHLSYLVKENYLERKGKGSAKYCIAKDVDEGLHSIYPDTYPSDYDLDDQLLKQRRANSENGTTV